MNLHKKISLIIPAHNEEAYINDCLKTVTQSAADLLHEIIVIDNASTDRTSEIALMYRGVRIVKEPRRGISFARQRGLEAATGEILAYIDADTRVPSGWVHIAAQTFRDHPLAVCLSGPYRYYDCSRPKRAILNAINRTVLPLGYRLFGHMVIGGNFVATKQSVIEAGGFDQTIDFFGEDTDLGRRLKNKGEILFREDFFLWSSARRYDGDGFLKANITYLLNFLWVIFFHRPLSTSHTDVRMDATRTNRKLWLLVKNAYLTILPNLSSIRRRTLTRTRSFTSRDI